MGDRPLPDLDAIDRALRRATNRMRRIHAALGLPIVTGKDDRVVYLDPVTLEEIPEGEVDAFIERARRMLDD